MIILYSFNPAPPGAGLPFLYLQKQCLSGKVDGLSERTDQRLPPGGSSRRSRVRESALRYNQYKSKVARAPSVTLRVPPSSRRKAMLPPDSTLIRCNTLYLACKTCKKGQRISHSLSFSVGANCVRPRAFTERPYEDDFLSVGITCFMEGTPLSPHFLLFLGVEIFPIRKDIVKS